MPLALITGATSGIGFAFARHLATAGYGLILVARDEARLAERRQVLLDAGAPEVHVIAADLTLPADRDRVAERLRSDPPVDLLINNAGSTVGKEFEEADPAELVRQVELLTIAVMVLARAALPAMRQRGHGGIVNVASIAGLVPGRGSSYAAGKAFVIALSEGLAMSAKGSGVHIQALCPGFVRTEFHQRAGIDMSGTPAWMYVDEDHLVRTSLADLRANRPISIPGALYKAMYLASRVAPRSLVRAVGSRVKNRGRT